MGLFAQLGLRADSIGSLAALIVVGLVIGVIAGMFGVGGGFLLTPLLIYAFGVPPATAVGSALCQKCGTSISSFLKFRRYGRGEPRIDLVMLGGSLMGVDAGTKLLSALNSYGSVVINGHRASAVQLTLDILFIILLSGVACQTGKDALEARKRVEPRGDVTIPGPLITKVHIPPYVSLPEAGLDKVSVPMLAYMGFVLGLLSGLMGIGGGVLFMPVLLYGIGLSMRNAAGTGVLVLLLTVAVGTFEQALAGFVNLGLSMSILMGSSVGSQVGVFMTHRLSNRVLRVIFTGLVATTVVMIVWDLLRLLHWL